MGDYKTYGYGGTGINETWVCCQCRLTQRHTKSVGGPYGPPCSKCRRQMTCIGDKIRVPKKNDNKGWAKLANARWRKFIIST